MSKSLQQNIVETSHRLRMVQKGFADEDQERRTEYLCEELDRRLKEIPYGERRAFLQGLLAQFPTGQPGGPSVAGQVCPPGEVLSPALADPLHLAEELIGRLPSMAPDQRGAVLGRLREGIQQLLRAGDASGKASENVESIFGPPDGKGPHAGRLGTLASLLTEFVVKLERWTASVWVEMANKSALRPPKHIEEIARRYLSQDTCDVDEITKELQLLQQFVTVIMAAARKAADEVARRHFHKFSPEAIRASVEMEPGGLGQMLVSKEIRYWRKYCELAEELGTEYVDREIASVMAEYAEAFLKKLERSAKTTGGA